MEEPATPTAESRPHANGHIVHAMMQFAVALRHRKKLVFASLMGTALLGGLYFATATRYYSAEASLLVLQTGAEFWKTSMSSEVSKEKSLMPTYVKLFASTEVLENALKKLSPEDRVDFHGAPEGTEVDVLRANLSASSVWQTNIIVVNYRSKSPTAAVAVVDAVVEAYTEFMDETHKSTSGEILRMLNVEKKDVAEKLAHKEVELLDTRERCGALGVGTDDRVTPPAVQRTIAFHDSLVEVHKERLAQEATLAAIRGAVYRGEDLQQHLVAIANVVGQDVLLGNLGLSAGDATTQASLRQELLNLRAQMASLRQELGDAHPKITALLDRARMIEDYLHQYPRQISEQFKRLQSSKIAPMLLAMAEQKLAETLEHERGLDREYESAQKEAILMNGELARLELVEHDRDWLRTRNETLLNRITTLDFGQEGQEIRTRRISSPEVDATPVSPNLARVLLMVLIVGVGIGLALVYAVDALDDRFRSLEEIQSHLGVPVVAVVRELKIGDVESLETVPVNLAPDTTESEVFRTLRTAMAFSDGETRRVVVSSPAPGDGKTTILTNLAVSFAQAQKKTLLIDADLRRPRLSALAGMRGTGGLAGIIRDEGDVAKLAAIHIQSSGINDLDVLPAGLRPADPAELLSHPRFAELLSWAETVYDQILIDSPPILATSDTTVTGRLVDGLLVVVQPEKNRRRLITRAIEQCAALKIPILGVVVNLPDSGGSMGYGDNYGYDAGYGYGSDQADDEMQPEAEDAASRMTVNWPATDRQTDPSPIVPRRVA